MNKNEDNTIYHLPTVSHDNDVNERMPVIKDSPERKEWINLYGDLKKTKRRTKKKRVG